MISLVLGILNALSAPSPIASAEAAAPSVDVSGVLELEQSPEEQMVGRDLPPTPESGSENPEDLLKSAPAIEQAHRPTKSASAKGASHDGLPASLPPVKGAKSTPLAPPIHEALPPVEDAAVSDTDQNPEDVGAPAEELPATAETPADAEPAPMETVDVPAEPAPETVATDESPGESGTTTKKWDRSIPVYDRANPHWGIDIHGSMEALGTSIKADDTEGNTTETNVRNFGLGFEYEPEFLQSIGVVSIGPSFNMYIMDPAGDITSGPFSIYSVGASVKYQLKFMRGQWFVPFAGYEYQQIRYSFQDANVGSGWTSSSGPVFGGMLLLNWMEPSAAYNLFADSGIRRSYLVGEVKNLQSSDIDVLSSDGIAIYFGLRLEY
jgi:hypothetical protein